MKTVYAYICIVLAAALCLIPLLSLKTPKAAETKVTVSAQTYENTKVKVYFPKTDTTEDIPLNDYLFGVLCAEVSPNYQTEALKAQTVAAYTYLLYKSERYKDKSYDITADAGVDQAYTERDEALLKWGENGDEYAKKYDEVIKSVSGEYLTYGGKAAMTVYCAISPGKTESAENVWGSSIPYLVPVESTGDLLAKDYLTTASISFDDTANALKTLGVTTGPENFFQNINLSSSGSVISADFGDVTLSGDTIRKALALKSAAFDVTAENEMFNFNIRGYGHGVGLSQNGAEYMALQGNNYKEILLHYYPGCELQIK